MAIEIWHLNWRRLVLPSLTKRQSSAACPATYTTFNGLNFTLHCSSDHPDSDVLSQSTESNVKACMDRCSTSQCAGVVYHTATRTCYLKGPSIASAAIKGSTSSHVAIAQADQLAALNGTCPGEGSIQTSGNGLDFETHCNSTSSGANLCGPSGLNSTLCPATNHTASMSDCLDLCSTFHPYCGGVSWDFGLSNGYGNCQLKASALSNGTAQLGSSNSTHVALARPHNQTDICSSMAEYLASNHARLTLHCNRFPVGATLAGGVFHTDSLFGCLEACAKNSTSNNGSAVCSSAVYDANMTRGFENCYLRRAVGEDMDWPGATWAQIVDVGNVSSGGRGGSKSNFGAWVAGPIVGGIVLVTLIIGLCAWLSERSKRPTAMMDGEASAEDSLVEMEIKTPTSHGRLTPEVLISDADVKEILSTPSRSMRRSDTFGWGERSRYI